VLRRLAYRETIRKSVEQESKFVRQSGGRGQYGHVWLRIEPQEAGAGYELSTRLLVGLFRKNIYLLLIRRARTVKMWCSGRISYFRCKSVYI